jgi:beta-N-acetylhexosaminidase
MAVAGIAVIACATSAPASTAKPGDRPSAASVTAAPAAVDPAASSAAAQPAVLATLTPAQLAGQRVIYSYSGLTPPASLLSLIAHGDVAGVIFFGGNISSEPQIASVIKTLEKADAAPTNPVKLPLLLMTDQEGGLVRRLPGAPFLSEKQIGASASPANAAAAAGQNAAANLRGVGMNVNLAPVLDVFRTAGDFDDQFQRSYSMNPHVAASAGAAFIRAQQAGGVAATAKHFPGLGSAAASQNTDLRPVTLTLSLASLRAVDEVPYPAAISAGVRLVMLNWASYSAVDPARPAGLSSRIVQGELRSRLGFKGVTITDAIEAGALKPFGSIQNRALLAAEAGMDLILCSQQSVTEGTQCTAGLQSGLSSGKLSKLSFQQAVARIMALRSSLPA